MRRQLIVANWKLNGNWAFNEMMMRELSTGLANVESLSAEIVLCPPAVYLQQLNGLMGNVPFLLGGQDISEELFGAFTGEISGQMLKELGCRYSLVGHSERRLRHHETNELVALKARTALACGITPIICIGESLEQRESGKMKSHLTEQVEIIINTLNENISQVIFAYEPLWAIGTGVTASISQAKDAHEMIRNVLKNHDDRVSEKVRILYGGSVKGDNAKDLLASPNIDGVLVGGASLVVTEFLEICLSSNNSK